MHELTSVDVYTPSFAQHDAPLMETDTATTQARAMEALEMSIKMRRHTYIAGHPGMGCREAVLAALRPVASTRPTPPDWAYVMNFGDITAPFALTFPAGGAHQFREDMASVVSVLADTIPQAFSSNIYLGAETMIQRTWAQLQTEEQQKISILAQELHIKLIQDMGGLKFAPLVEGEEISQVDYAALPADIREEISARIQRLQDVTTASTAALQQAQQQRDHDLHALAQSTTHTIYEMCLEPFRVRYADNAGVLRYFDTLVQHCAMRGYGILFRDTENTTHQDITPFAVNILVDNTDTQGAPIIEELGGSYHEVMGQIQHRVVGNGNMVTDFLCIKAGAIHRANGGYLVLDAQDVLTKPFAWQALMRALKEGTVRIREMGTEYRLIVTTTLELESIPLDVMIILIGTSHIYHLLRAHDDHFSQRFSVLAEFGDVNRTAMAEAHYAGLITQHCQTRGGRTPSPTAMARILEHAARQAGDAQKLTPHVSSLYTLVEEADYYTAESQEYIDAAAIVTVITQKRERAGRLRDMKQEALQRGILLVDVMGAVVGQVNGLYVSSWAGEWFGMPFRVTASVGASRQGSIIDVEREVDMGGSIHAKGTQIVTGYLTTKLAQNAPLACAIRLVFEQGYGTTEGDSASVAEVCAAVSALAGLPVQQGVAVTGSINQLGHIQPVGGVDEKIEGFFALCAEWGLTREQGVIIPATNVPMLMLNDDVQQAIDEGQFHIWAVETVEEALTHIMQQPIDTIFERAQTRLRAYTQGHQTWRQKLWAKIQGLR